MNTGPSAVNLDGWVFDDDDDGAVGGAMGGPNIVASPGNNTMVPAGGVAVLYPGDELAFMPERFSDAWVSGITLVGVDGFTALSAGDAIGLWPSRASYNADAIAGATMSPRRTFAGAAASFNYASVDEADASFSIAWNGSGSVTDPANWAQSADGLMGAFVSEETTIENAQINSLDDRGNPGVPATGSAAAEVRITEIMFAPKSPQVTVGYSSDDFEWVEILNGRPTPIDFASTNFVLDDASGSELQSANVKEGVLAAGAVGVLFNGDKISATQMEAMWGAGNYFPVERWPALNNTGPETIGIWSSIGDYEADNPADVPRTFASADEAVTYHTQNSQGWPTTSVGNSIWLKSLSGDPNDGANWSRANAVDDTVSHNALPIFELAVDHPGGDIGSPGFVPGVPVVTLAGDYNGNGVVDAADYVLWRHAMQTSTPLPRDTTPESVSSEDYELWRANFGKTGAIGSSLANASVPEPMSGVMIVMAAGWLGLRPRRAPRSSKCWGLADARPQAPKTMPLAAFTRRRWRRALR